MSSTELKSPLTLTALPQNILLMCVKKLTAVPLCRLRRTCSYLNGFVEEHKKQLSRRVFEAPTMTEKTSLILYTFQYIGEREEKWNHLVLMWHTQMDVEFDIEIDKPQEAEKYLSSGIPIRMISVRMAVIHRPSLLRLADFLKNWNLFCEEIEFRCPAVCSVNILECVKAHKYSLHLSENAELELEVLKQSVKKDQLTINVALMPDESHDFLNECDGFKQVFCLSYLMEDNHNYRIGEAKTRKKILVSEYLHNKK